MLTYELRVTLETFEHVSYFRSSFFLVNLGFHWRLTKVKARIAG